MVVGSNPTGCKDALYKQRVLIIVYFLSLFFVSLQGKGHKRDTSHYPLRGKGHNEGLSKREETQHALIFSREGTQHALIPSREGTQKG